jgi:uncharacterized repeat protein (TIGR01451 family)
MLTNRLPRGWMLAVSALILTVIAAGCGSSGTGGSTGGGGSTTPTPALAVSVTHSGNFSQGQHNATYTLTVSVSTAATTGTVTVTDTLPSGLTLVSLAGTGWTCTAGTCTRADALASGSSYPAITATVNVATAAASPQVNSVTVSGGGSANATATDSTTITAVPALSISDSHAGNFSQGQLNATSTLTVSNTAGTATTSGLVTVTDTVPSGLSLVSLAGTGWTCAANVCTRADALASGTSGSSYPAITATVNVGPTATTPQVNSVTVSGGGSASATATDSITVTAVALLSITKTHSGNFTQGQQHATYTVTVSNTAGAGAPSGTVTVTDTLPSGLTLVSLAGTGWTCTAATCTRADAPPSGLPYPAITATVNVGSTATSPQINSVTVSGGGSVSATITDSTVITPVALLSITKSHQGTFTQGQTNLTYTITVSNTAGTAATLGAVTVTDNVPAGLTLVSLAGTGWTCVSTSCTRSDALATGLSYPAITATVNVGAAATSPQVNAVSVSGGGSVTANASDPTTVLPSTSTCANTATGNESVLHGQYAFLVQGYTGTDNLSPVAIVASFTADGSGNVTGGEEDLNSLAPQHLTISPTGGFYTVGSDNRGCLTLNYSGGTTTTSAFHFALGSMVSNLATKGRIIEFDDASGTDVGTRGSGVLRMQTPSAFSLGQLQPRYAFGLDGGDFTGGHFAVAGSFNLNNSTGVVSNAVLDTNDAGTTASSSAGTGTLASISATTGRGLFTLTAGSTVHLVAYIINPAEWFVVQTDLFSNNNSISSGRAIVTPGAYTAASLAGQQIIHLTGRTGGSGDISLGIMSFAPAPGNSGTSSGSLQTYDGTTANTLTISGQTYTVDPSSGRVTLSDNPTRTQPRIMYLTTTTNGVSAFVLGTDVDALFGLADAQPSVTYDVNSLSGNFFYDKEETGDFSTSNVLGISSIVSPGNANFIQDSSDGGLTTDFTFSTVIAVNPDGTGTETDAVNMATFIMVTNGTKVFYTNLAGPASIRVFEP